MQRRLLILLALLFLLIAVPATDVAAAGDPPALRQGDSGNDVYILQQKLQEYGYYDDELDGKFGLATKLAVTDFQADAGLEPDGIVSAATLVALREFKPGAIIASRAGPQSRTGLQLVSFAKQFLGVPYVWAGRSPSGFDCSGFISYVFGHYGVQVPRMADEQFEVGVSVSRRDLQYGDMVFFTTYEPGPSHVGIYIGNGQFIHASSGAGEVTITPLDKAYYAERYLGARRVLR